ncbi:MAG: UPF0149 family protein, partial [Gammaproteobacteria bacterium]|nr:UPF0149 family protein [Gammaproteobacteria bacterium]
MHDLNQPLDDDEIEWLREFLLDRIDDDADTEGRDEGILDISELDGFLTAVVSGPVTVLPSQWIPQVWGDFEPVWEREHDVQKVMTLLMRHMNAIAVMLMEQPGDFEPIFLERSYEGKTYTIVDEWCEGYMRAVALAADRWELDASEMRELLAPIKVFQGEHVLQTHDLYNDEEVRVLQEAIPVSVRRIHSFWLSKRTPSGRQAPPAPATIVGTPK